MTSRDYLIVDRFLQDELDAKALAFALKSGLIDKLLRDAMPLVAIPVGELRGRHLLADLLTANNVTFVADNALHLTSAFRSALSFRDLLEMKIDFLESVARDIFREFDALLDDLPRFMEMSDTFRLFRYDLCFDPTKANVAATSRWMRFTTLLTRYEAPVCIQYLNLGTHKRLLDIGGNSGEFAIHLREAFPDLVVTVFDLPVVCGIGRAHVAARDKAQSIAFVSGDLRRDPLPRGMDVCTLKSVLHDWPDDMAAAILGKAAGVLEAGCRLIIFERAPMRFDKRLPYAQLTNLVFFHFYRERSFYVRVLRDLDFHIEQEETIDLEMPFHLIVARKG